MQAAAPALAVAAPSPPPAPGRTLLHRCVPGGYQGPGPVVGGWWRGAEPHILQISRRPPLNNQRWARRGPALHYGLRWMRPSAAAAIPSSSARPRGQAAILATDQSLPSAAEARSCRPVRRSPVAESALASGLLATAASYSSGLMACVMCFACASESWGQCGTLCGGSLKVAAGRLYRRIFKSISRMSTVTDVRARTSLLCSSICSFAPCH